MLILQIKYILNNEKRAGIVRERIKKIVFKHRTPHITHRLRFAYFLSDKIHIIKVHQLDKQYQNLIIFDDFVTQKDQNLIIDLFIRGRKKNTSVIYLTQTYFSTLKDIRL
jgi:hypothetical protein